MSPITFVPAAAIFGQALTNGQKSCYSWPILGPVYGVIASCNRTHRGLKTERRLSRVAEGPARRCHHNHREPCIARYEECGRCELRATRIVLRREDKRATQACLRVRRGRRGSPGRRWPRLPRTPARLRPIPLLTLCAAAPKTHAMGAPPPRNDVRSISVNKERKLPCLPLTRTCSSSRPNP